MTHCTGQENVCSHVTKNLDFINKYTNQKVVKYLDRFFRNLAETDKKLGFFEIKNHKIDFFSIFS